jgi:hypothetical protein
MKSVFTTPYIKCSLGGVIIQKRLTNSASNKRWMDTIFKALGLAFYGLCLQPFRKIFLRITNGSQSTPFVKFILHCITPCARKKAAVPHDTC